MQETRGAVRVDLVGGTLDIFPLNLQIPKVVTVNMALSLEARVRIEKTHWAGVEIISDDYGKSYAFKSENFTEEKLFFSDDFKEMTFMAQVLFHCGQVEGLRVHLSSGAPAGSGLGGSSAMAVVLYRAVKTFQGKPFKPLQAISDVREIESRILRAGVAGYQDYYPAVFGGVLALHPAIGGERMERLRVQGMREFLEARLGLIYSGVSRDSGINNWEVYKKFYDKDSRIQKGLEDISLLAHQAYTSLKKGDFESFLLAMEKEGKKRSQLFPRIRGEKIEAFESEAVKLGLIRGLKVCGAGGGGCFMPIYPPKKDETALVKLLEKYQMRELPFKLGLEQNV